METIIATLNSIRYQNGNGFMIGMARSENVKSESKTLATCVAMGNGFDITFVEKGDFGILGNMLSPQVGMTYKLTGEWSKHQEFGDQFKFTRHEIIKPSDKTGIYKYIVRTAKWVGPTIGQRLVDLYGENTLEVLRNDPEMVACEIIGLTPKRAKTIQEMLIEQEETEAVMVELLSVLDFPGLRKSLPIEIASKYGSNSIEVLKENPYVLTEFNGVGFLIADRIATQSFEISTSSIYRTIAAIKYIMQEDLNSIGSTWIDIDLLIKNVTEVTGNSIDQIEAGLHELIEGRAIVVVDNVKGWKWFSFFEVDLMETLISDKIKEMLKT